MTGYKVVQTMFLKLSLVHCRFKQHLKLDFQHRGIINASVIAQQKIWK